MVRIGMRCVLFVVVAVLLAGIGVSAAQTLDIYFIDVEGGQATLVVTPAGQSMLIDTGWDGFDNRDPKRILAAARDAGVKQLDYLLITHFHRDHAVALRKWCAIFLSEHLSITVSPSRVATSLKQRSKPIHPFARLACTAVLPLAKVFLSATLRSMS